MSADEAIFSAADDGVLLWTLAGPDSAVRAAAAVRLVSNARDTKESTGDYTNRLRAVLIDEWNALGSRGPLLVTPLINVLLTDPGLLTIEVVAVALALQGEDGATELVSLLSSDDFVMRHKAAIGIGALDGSARWAVPAISAALEREPQPLVVKNLVNALGRIGGAQAVGTLETVRDWCEAQPPGDAEITTFVEDALARAKGPT